MNQFLKQYTNDEGRPFNVQLVMVGDKYGLNDCLIMDGDEPSVEFYDASQDPEKFGEIGQFTGGRYNLSTIQSIGENRGLIFYGGEPVWYLDGMAMDAVKKDLYEYMILVEGRKVKEKIAADLFNALYEANMADVDNEDESGNANDLNERNCRQDNLYGSLSMAIIQLGYEKELDEFVETGDRPKFCGVV